MKKQHFNFIIDINGKKIIDVFAKDEEEAKIILNQIIKELKMNEN